MRGVGYQHGHVCSRGAPQASEKSVGQHYGLIISGGPGRRCSLVHTWTYGTKLFLIRRNHPYTIPTYSMCQYARLDLASGMQVCEICQITMQSIVHVRTEPLTSGCNQRDAPPIMVFNQHSPTTCGETATTVWRHIAD